jgi:isopropylmalate/homocitrate/citramalate synthase
VALRAHELLVLERVLLAGGFVALGGRDAVAAAVTAAAVLVTWVAQRTLRDRYEFAPAGAGAGIGAAAVLSYVDAQLAAMAGPDARPPAALAGWDRRITIDLTDIDLRVGLVVRAGTVRRTTDPGGPDLDQVTVATTAATFADIFLLGRTNPRRAYLARRIRIDGAPRDLLRLNQVFNQFRRSTDAGRTAPAPATWTSTVDEQSAGDGPAGQLPGLVVISDTTLRDGEQMPGAAFSTEQKVDLACRLAALGIPLIEAGFPAVSAAEAEAVRAVVAAGLAADIQVIARPLAADIDAAVATGADSIAIFVGTSDSHLTAKLRIEPARLLRQVADAVGYAKESGRNVVFAAEDATRADPGFLVEICQAAQDAGADALGLADTAGVATPWSIQALVRRVTAASALPVAVHCHNDLGLATANSLAALLAGASGVQCSVLGIGERAGNAALEEVLLSLEVAFGHRTGCDLAALVPLAGRVAALLGQPVPPGRPVVGPNAFVHESGLHVDGIVRDPSTYEPYPPELVGRTRQLVFGKHSGRSALRRAVAGHGLALDETQLGRLLDEVKTAGLGPPGLSELDVVRLARNLAAAPLTATTSGNQGAS